MAILTDNHANFSGGEKKQSIVDWGFYLIQRGEAGHLRGCYNQVYKDSGGIDTIGYGTVTLPGYNSLNFRGSFVTEEQAIMLAKAEMAEKINEKCRSKFKDFDNLLPCYQAAILDTTYQGNWGAIQNAMNDHDMQAVYNAIINNPNHERSAVRGRAIEMGILIEQAQEQFPDLDPKKVAEIIAMHLIEKYKYLNGTDSELTKDELALLYRSCMAAYGIEVSDNEIEAFAMQHTEVASGMCGIGHSYAADLYNGVIPSGPSYDGSRYTGGSNGGSGFGSMGARYSARLGMGGMRMTPSKTFYENIPFQADSTKLEIRRDFASPNRGDRRGMNPQMIVLHATESYSLATTLNTFQSSSENTSAHYVIDRDGTIYQLVPENMKANHAGRSMWQPLGIDEINGCNAASIGIEIQRGPNEGYTKEQIASTMALVKDIQERRGIKPENTVGHADVAQPFGRKVDPGDDFPWDAFEEEGLAYGKKYHRGGDHAANIWYELNKVRSKDCQFYNFPDVSDEPVREKALVRLAPDLTEKLKAAESAGTTETKSSTGKKLASSGKKHKKSSGTAKKSGETKVALKDLNLSDKSANKTLAANSKGKPDDKSEATEKPSKKSEKEAMA